MDSSSNFHSPTFDEHKAQYAAWRERLMNRSLRPDVIDLDEADENGQSSMWSVEALFAQPVDDAEGAQTS